MSESYLGHLNDWGWRGYSVRYSYTPTTTSSAAAPAILVHGFGASLGHWRSNIPLLSCDRSVYAIDLLGCGGSSKPTDIHYTVDLWVEQLYEFWRDRIRQPAILSGHSLGGLIALTAAARYPEMVKGLNLISCADGPHPEEFPPPIGWAIQGLTEAVMCLVGFPGIYPLFFRRLRQEKPLRKAIRNTYKIDERVDDELVKIFQQPAFEEGAQEVLLELLRAILTRRFESPRLLLPKIQVPILILWGKDDPAVPSFFADKFVQWNPACQLVKLPGIGHCAHDELPRWVTALIAEWATGLETGQTFGLTYQAV
ncbi:MAG: alpha/beta fold hydrolase [Cyanobacteria bacterium P01_E01_bin.45]